MISLSDLKDERLKTVSMITGRSPYNSPFSSDTTNSDFLNERPFLLQNDLFSVRILYINQDYYKNHKEEVDLALSSLLTSLQGKEIILGETFINENTVQGIAQNPNLTKIDLQGYSLEKNIFDLLSQSKSIQEIITPGVAKELANSYDSRITYRMNQRIGMGLNTLKRLLTEDYIKIDSCDLKEVLEVLKHRKNNLPKNINIEVTDYSFLENFMKDIASLYDGITFEDELFPELFSPKSAEIVFQLDPSNINLSVLKRIEEMENSNVRQRVVLDFEELSLSKAIQTEEKIRSLLEPVMMIKDQLSPFELYTKLYEIVKDFKKYQIEDEGMYHDASRSVSNILFNDYIVCAGYVNLLQTFCNRFGLTTGYMPVSVLHEEQENLGVTGHARLFVHIKDEKYDIDGVYISDPTWDSMGETKYNHLLMTLEEIDRERDSEGIFDVTFNPYDFLKVKTPEELEEMLKNPTLKEMFQKLPSALRSIDNGEFMKSCQRDYDLEEETTKEKLKEYCVAFQQEPISGDKILASLVHIYQLEHKDVPQEELIDHFQTIRAGLKKRENLYYPTIETVSSSKRTFDFLENKYDNVNVEEIVNEEFKNHTTNTR